MVARLSMNWNINQMPDCYKLEQTLLQIVIIFLVALGKLFTNWKILQIKAGITDLFIKCIIQ